MGGGTREEGVWVLDGGGSGVAGGSGNGEGLDAEFKGEIDIYLCE